MRKRIPVVVCILCGTFMAAQYFVNEPRVTALYRTILEWMQVIFVCALLAGVIRVIAGHVTTVLKARRERAYAAIALFGIALMVALGLGWGVAQGSPFLWAFDNLQAPMQTTVFSLLAFYVASAAYRGFRARRLESAMLVAAALVVLLGRVPIGEMLSPYVPLGVDWVLSVPSVAAKRALLIGIGLGMTTTAIKVIVGLERTYTGER